MNKPKFIYENYEIREDDKKIYFQFYFEIENVSKFSTIHEILKKDFKWKHLKSNVLRNLVFNLGIVEAISYYKAVCSKEFHIKCGYLNEAQAKWYRKLFYYGLGEFRYVNKISSSEEDFVDFISDGEEIEIESELEKLVDEPEILVPVGGGKDSNVTLELLKNLKNKLHPFLINGKENSYQCIEASCFKPGDIVEVNRILDKNIIELNNKGYLNGHTPFSAMVAFLSYTVAFMLGFRYIALSNENSANESNVDGLKINHQYSKSFEFENDFRQYYQKYLRAGNTEYFSFLRPISELQIGYLFSKFPKYHKVFKSCNVGSKQKPWIWCGECPKCLFVYIILSPFINKEEMIKIFGKNLLEKESLKETFIELCGFGEIKPFECVGTYSEVRWAVSKLIKELLENGKELPYLLDFYYKNFELEDTSNDRLKAFSDENNLPEEFKKLLFERLLEENLWQFMSF